MNFNHGGFIKLLLLCLLLVGCSETGTLFGPSRATYALLDGGDIDLKSPGKVTLINYWATWCAPCRKEIPELNHLLDKHHDKLMVLGINFDGLKGDDLRSEVAKLGIVFPSLLHDPRQLWHLEPVAVLPETLVIDRDGKLLRRLIGPQTAASLEDLLW